MDRRYLIFYILIFILLLSNIIIAEEGSYNLVIKRNEVSLSPGESLLVPIFIYGYGPLEKAKIGFYSDRVFKIEDLQIFGIILPSSKISDVSYGVDTLPDEITKKVKEDIQEGSMITYGDIGRLSRQEGASFPPFHYNITLKKEIDGQKIEGGDYRIRFILSYYDGERWYTSTDDLIIHVLTWQERYVKTITLIMAIVAVIGVAWQILTTKEELRRRDKIIKIIFGILLAFILYLIYLMI